MPQISASISAPLAPPISLPVSPRVRQRSTHSSDDIIGLVLVDKKKFRCPKKECDQLTFGRLADLRRHHDQNHARNRAQYYCPYQECDRSYVPGGGRSKSFGTRKDKRDEHIRNVHENKRRRGQSQQYSPAASL